MNPVTPDPAFREYVAMRAYDYYIIILCASINMASLYLILWCANSLLIQYTYRCSRYMYVCVHADVFHTTWPKGQKVLLFHYGVLHYRNHIVIVTVHLLMMLRLQ